MNLLLKNFTELELTSIFNPLGYLKDKLKDEKLYVAIDNLSDTSLFELHNIKIDHVLCPDSILVDAKEIGQRNNYSSFPQEFSSAAGLKSFVINDFVFDNPIFIYLKKLIEDKKLYKDSIHRGYQVLFIFSESFSLNKALAYLIGDLLSDGIPCVASTRIKNSETTQTEHECNDLKFVKLKKMSSIASMLEEILNSSLVITDLNPAAIIACNCFVPILMVGTASSLYRYLNPYQPHIFCTDDKFSNLTDIRNLKKLILQAYEFYDSA